MCIWYDVRIKLHFLRGYTVVPAPFIEKSIFSPLNCFETLAENQMIISIKVYFWTLNFIPFISKSVLMLVPHSLDYFSFVVCFKIGKYAFSNFELFHSCFDYSGPFSFRP